MKKIFILFFILTLIFLVNTKSKASTYPSGSLLALENTPSATVYIIKEDNKKYAFPDSKTYFTYYDNFDNVQRVNLSTLDSYPDGGVMPYRAGTKLITHQNTAKVYAVEPNGVIRWIPTEQIAISLYGSNWATRVQDVIPGYFSTSYSLGADLSDTLPNGTIVRVRNTNEYYYIEDGQKIIATNYQEYHSEDIVEVDDVANYPDDDGSTSGDDEGGNDNSNNNPTPPPSDNEGGGDEQDNSTPPDDGSGSGSDTPEPTPTPTPLPVDNDIDNDGYDSTSSGGTDCNDSSASIHPGATDICGDSIDQDCSGSDLSCPSSAAQLLAFEDFEDSDWTDNFSRAVNEINVSMSSDVAMGSVSSRMYGGSLGASFDYIFADHGLSNVQDGDKYYIKYYTYYDTSFVWEDIVPTGWKQFRGMPPDGWPLVMMKFGEGSHTDLFTHSYYESLSDQIPDRIDISRPSHNEWHLHEYYLSYGVNSGGFAWYIDGVLVAGIPLEEHTMTNWPRNTGTPVYEVNGFRLGGGNGAPAGSVYYVDNIEIWKGIP